MDGADSQIQEAMNAIRETKIKSAVQIFRATKVTVFDDADVLTKHWGSCKSAKDYVGFGCTPEGVTKYLPLPSHPKAVGNYCPGCVMAAWVTASQKAGAADHYPAKGRYGTKWAEL